MGSLRRRKLVHQCLRLPLLHSALERSLCLRRALRLHHQLLAQRLALCELGLWGNRARDEDGSRRAREQNLISVQVSINE